MPFWSISRIASVAAGSLALLLAGTAAQAAGTPVSSTPSPMPAFNAGVYALAYDGNTIYVGGSFTTATSAGKTVARAGLAAINATTGALLPWTPTTNGRVDALAVDPATHAVYVAGRFSQVDHTGRDGLAELDGATGALGAFHHGLSGDPHALAVGHGRLYLGGRFTAVDGVHRTNAAAFTLATGALDAGWAPVADDAVEAVYPDSARIYLGGKFRTVNGVAGTAKLAAVSPDTGVGDAGFAPAVNDVVWGIAVGPNGVYAAEGGPGGRVIAYASTGANQWTFTTDGDVQAVAYLNGVVYTGGHYDNACQGPSNGPKGFCNDGSVKRVKLAAVDAATGLLNAWDPHGNGVHGVFALAAGATVGSVAAAGEFTAIHGGFAGRYALFK